MKLDPGKKASLTQAISIYKRAILSRIVYFNNKITKGPTSGGQNTLHVLTSLNQVRKYKIVCILCKFCSQFKFFTEKRVLMVRLYSVDMNFMFNFSDTSLSPNLSPNPNCTRPYPYYILSRSR